MKLPFHLLSIISMCHIHKSIKNGEYGSLHLRPFCQNKRNEDNSISVSPISWTFEHMGHLKILFIFYVKL